LEAKRRFADVEVTSKCPALLTSCPTKGSGGFIAYGVSQNKSGGGDVPGQLKLD
jgi:hypothetical protein